MKPKTIKNISGRQRLTWPVLEGIAATAATIGAPAQLLKSVKKTGSKAFISGNRIDTGILIPELFAALAKDSESNDGFLDPVQEKAGLDRERKLALIRARKIDEKELMHLDTIEELLWQNLLAPLREEILQAGKFCFPNDPNNAAIVATRMTAILKKIHDVQSNPTT